MLQNNEKLKMAIFLSLAVGVIIILESILLTSSYGLTSNTNLSFTLLLISGIIIAISALVLLITDKQHVIFGLLIVFFSTTSLLARVFYSVYDTSYFIFNVIIMILGVIGGIITITYHSSK